MDDNAFLSAKAVASANGVHVRTVYRWAQMGYLEVERAGEKGHYRIPRESLSVHVRRSLKMGQDDHFRKG